MLTPLASVDLPPFRASTFDHGDVLSGLSLLAAGWMAQRFGLLNTMVPERRGGCKL
jgi:hypothetical protein